MILKKKNGERTCLCQDGFFNTSRANSLYWNMLSNNLNLMFISMIVVVEDGQSCSSFSDAWPTSHLLVIVSRSHPSHLPTPLTPPTPTHFREHPRCLCLPQPQMTAITPPFAGCSPHSRKFAVKLHRPRPEPDLMNTRIHCRKLVPPHSLFRHRCLVICVHTLWTMNSSLKSPVPVVSLSGLSYLVMSWARGDEGWRGWMIKGRHYEVDAPDGRSRLKVPHTFTRDPHRTSVLHARASEFQQSSSLPTLHHVDKLSFATIVLFFSFHPTRKEGGGSGGERERACV